MSTRWITGRGFQLAIAALLLAALGLAGCGAGGGSDGDSGPVAGAPADPGVGAPLPPVLPPPVAPVPCLAGPTVGGINVLVSQNVISGVAPLAVFFDATATTSAATTIPFHELEYRWDFKETVAPGNTNWAYGRPGASRGFAQGPLAAHVFETPGTYDVCVSVTDGTSIADGQITITVTDPATQFAGNTLCVSTSGNFGACPGGCAGGNRCEVSNDFDDMINGAAFGNRGAGFKRVLFRSGETFVANASGTLRANGPGHIGAYDAGVRPVIQSPNQIPVIVGHSSNLGFNDWRIVDLDFDGQNLAQNAVFPNGPASRITFLRNRFRNHSLGMQLLPSVVLNPLNTAPNLAPIWNQWAIVDNEFSNFTQNGFLGALNASAILGNRVHPQNTEHAIRLTFGQKVIIAHNELIGSPSGIPASAGASALQVRGVHVTPGSRNTGESANTIPANTFTEQILVSDNKLLGGDPFPTNGAAFVFGIRAVNSPDIVWFRDIIVERNWMVAHRNTGEGAFMQMESTLTTIRNNLFDLDAIPAGATNGMRGIWMTRNGGGAGLATSNVFVYNNSVYSGQADGGSAFVLVDAFGGGNPVVVRNNLGYAPLNIDGATAIVRNPAGVTQSNNSDTVATIQTDPLFAATPPVNPLDWTPQPGSYADGGGAAQGQPSVLPTNVPVFSDYFTACVPDCNSARAGTHIGAVNP